jgi:hypothetical protein
MTALTIYGLCAESSTMTICALNGEARLTGQH